jgi:iron complex outermembrane receptor protein
MRLVFLILGLSLSSGLLSQQTDSLEQIVATHAPLQEVTVKAFSSRLLWKAVPAAVAVITGKDMTRFGNVSLVPVFNTVPGVRMEERSPASYRLSIRGSLLRSPFGVRNIKVYWNDIPLTDGGGNTYINLVDIDQLTGAEVIKGPAASVYGAGTGGAVLLQSGPIYPLLNAKNNFTAGLTGGSFGLIKEQFGWDHSSKDFTSSLQQSHLQSDGYREQSASRRDAVKWQGGWKRNMQRLKFLFFYTDLYYQTPGGIILAQMQANPKSARPTAGAIPGSVQQKAAIYNKTVFGGLSHEIDFNELFTLKSFVTANSTDFTNPFITNYEERSEQNLGGGTHLVFHTRSSYTSFQWMNGIEWLHNHSTIDDYGNRSGVKDTVQFKDNVYANQWFAFSQMQVTLHDKWVFTAGLSLNNQSYRYRRLTDVNSSYVKRSISAIITPRFAMLYRINNDVSLYAIAAKGFSPPALAEVRPSDGNFYGDLAAESGWNYEAGIKGELFGQRLQFDLATYYFKLQNAIVRRNNSAGAEYFVNAGGTEQKGIEAFIKYQLAGKTNGFLSGWHIWSSYSYQPYRFTDYKQLATDYTGKELTGVPRNVWVSGMDIETVKGFYLNASLNCTSALPLNDANDAYADAYQLLQFKLGYRSTEKKTMMDVFAGVDNLLNQVYSLGNDINAAGRRYYNPATGRNVFAGVILRF